MATNSEIEDAVVAYLETTNGHWRKVAMVFVRVEEALGEDSLHGQFGHDLFDSAIDALVSSGRLIAKGDITQWRFSEVKLS